MKSWYFRYFILLVTISLVGLVFTQIFWLKKAVTTSEKQFDGRADRMLHDVIGEIKEYADTSSSLKKIPPEKLEIFDVVDTNLLGVLLEKYTNYHLLDSVYSYALVRTKDKAPIYTANHFKASMESGSYKACLSCLWKKQYLHLSVFFPYKRRSILMQLSSWIFLSVLFLMIITGAFIFITYNFLRQKKLTEIKNDFINNMTHEFKTPISTISLASEMLIKGSSSPTKGKIEKYAQIIFDENLRMRSQVELVLQTALIDRGQLKLHKDMTDLHDLIKSTVSSFSLEAVEKEVSFRYALEAYNPILLLDQVHIRNVFSNIIDNAIKYSGFLPEIGLATQSINGGVMISVSDNGMGMSRDTQKKIFEKFYRVSTGNIHNVKGFGLGLYYVKTIVEAHNGNISVQSDLNKGSTFNVYLPQT